MHKNDIDVQLLENVHYGCDWGSFNKSIGLSSIIDIIKFHEFQNNLYSVITSLFKERKENLETLGELDGDTITAISIYGWNPK